MPTQAAPTDDVRPAVRWALAGAAFSAVTWRLEGSLRVSRRDLSCSGALAAIGLWLNQSALAYAARLASAATVALSFGTLPIFVALLSQLGGVERLRLRQWPAIGVSFSGVALVAVGGGARISGDLGGVLLALVTAARCSPSPAPGNSQPRTGLGALFALAVLSESLQPLQIAGGLVVGAAILLARSRSTPAPAAE